MMDDIAAKLIRRTDSLKAIRQPNEAVWRECYDYTYPLRGAGFSSDVSMRRVRDRKSQSCWMAPRLIAPEFWPLRLCLA